jgi:hypothetical protein
LTDHFGDALDDAVLLESLLPLHRWLDDHLT